MAEKIRCGRRVKRCRNKKCGHRYPAIEYDLWNCPNCGTDRYCRVVVKEEGLACKRHGGASLKGIEHPNYQRKGFSKYLTKRLRAKHAEFEQESKILSLEKLIAVNYMLTAENLEKLDGTPVLELWTAARDLWDETMAWGRKGNQEKFNYSLGILGKVLSEGVEETKTQLAIEKQVNTNIETGRRLMDSQRQIMESAQELIRVGWVIMSYDLILEGMKENVLPLEGGAQATRAIAEIIRSLAGRYALPGIDSPS